MKFALFSLSASIWLALVAASSQNSLNFPLTYDPLAASRLSSDHTHLHHTVNNLINLRYHRCLKRKVSRTRQQHEVFMTLLKHLRHRISTKLMLNPFSTQVELDFTGGSWCDEDWGGAATVAATNDNRDVAWFATFQLGSARQNIRLDIDTGSADLFVYGPTCTSCSLNNHTAFQSQSWTPLEEPNTFKVTYQDGSELSGVSGTDTVAIVTSGKALEAKMIVNVATTASARLARNTYEGYMGLGPDVLAVVPNTTTFFSSLIKNESIEPVLGIAFIGIKGGSDLRGGGYLTFGGIMENYIRGSLVTTPVTSTNYWGIELSGIFINGVNQFTSSTPPRGLLDTGTSLTFTSTKVSNQIHAQIPGAWLNTTSLLWTVPCTIPKGVPNIFFQIGGSMFGFPADQFPFSQRDDGTCLSAIQGGSENFTLLGGTFIKNVYLALKVDAKTQEKSVGIGNRTDVPYIG